MDRTCRPVGVLALLGSGLTFGALPLFITWLARDGVGGWFQLAARLTLAPAIMFALFHVFAPHLVRIADRRALSALIRNGLVTLTCFTTYIFSIALGTPPAKAILLIQMFPIYVAVLAAVLLHERLTGKKVVAIAVGLLGTALMMRAQEIPGLTRPQVGDLLAMACGFMYACLIVAGRQTESKQKTHPLAWTAWSLFFALAWLGVLTLVVLIWAGPQALHALLPEQVTPRILANMLGLAVLGTVLPYGLMYAGLTKTEAGTASLLMLVEPVSVLGMSALFLGQTVGLWQIVGGSLILGAGLMSTSDRPGRLAHAIDANRGPNDSKPRHVS